MGEGSGVDAIAANWLVGKIGFPLIEYYRTFGTMPLAWNEIRHRAIKFSHDWSTATSESADKQTFWNEFFNVFNVKRRTVASFEAPVKKLSGHDGAIDLFWKGMLIVEHKSKGANLGKAESQAFDYIQSLASEGRHDEIPRYVIVSDFARFVLYDLEPEQQKDLPLFNQRPVEKLAEFGLSEFHKNIRPFAFIAGYKQQKLDPEDPANLKAAKIMANLHDALRAGNYTGHELRVFLVRVLFCLFAEDTGIFPQPRQFELYLTNHTAADGSDLGPKLSHLFEVLNTPVEKRQNRLEADLAEFPYVNGDLFKEHIISAEFNSDMRNALLGACNFRWEKISPAVFGSLFQEVMQAPERRQIGAHYTAEKNIMKVIRSLFLDGLKEEFEAIKADKSTRRAARIEEFHQKLAGLRFLDPACGCGNFLVITYRELRALELQLLRLKHGQQQEMTLEEVNKLSRLDVDQMYGIEIEEFPARIAEVALWLTDHQANVELSIAFTQSYIRIPLKKSPHIHVGNALRMDWKEVIAPEKCSYVLGNPPFVGGKFQTDSQREDMAALCAGCDNHGLLDFVSGWYFKAARYIQGTNIVVAFVSTNSITQGEQVAPLWRPLLDKYKIVLHFAHRTFAWESEARGRAHVHVVIIGFATFEKAPYKILDYDTDPEHPTASLASRISPYLTSGGTTTVANRERPICSVPEIAIGNKPIDGGFYLFKPEEKRSFLEKEPDAAPYFKRWIGADEFLNNIERWCLWVGDCPPDQLRSMPLVLERIESVRKYRLASKSPPTRKLAETPTRFHVENMPRSSFLVIPEVSSERRKYIPIGFLNPDVLCSNKVRLLPNASTFQFGVLSSAMHMGWVRQVTGRLKSDYQYSVTLVYNNFPWPQSPTPEQKAAVEKCAQAVLDARAQFPESTLADLYDPLTMPPVLQKAHAELDRAVDRCYRKEPFNSDRERVEFLFKLYEQLTAPLLPVAGKVKRKRKAEKEGWCEGAGFCDANRRVAKTRAGFSGGGFLYTGNS